MDGQTSGRTDEWLHKIDRLIIPVMTTALIRFRIDVDRWTDRKMEEQIHDWSEGWSDGQWVDECTG